jgi:hypothetical protein
MGWIGDKTSFFPEARASQTRKHAFPMEKTKELTALDVVVVVVEEVVAATVASVAREAKHRRKKVDGEHVRFVLLAMIADYR